VCHGAPLFEIPSCSHSPNDDHIRHVTGLIDFQNYHCHECQLKNTYLCTTQEIFILYNITRSNFSHREASEHEIELCYPNPVIAFKSTRVLLEPVSSGLEFSLTRSNYFSRNIHICQEFRLEFSLTRTAGPTRNNNNKKRCTGSHEIFECKFISSITVNY